ALVQLRDSVVNRKIISKDNALWQNTFLDNRENGLCLNVWSDLRDYTAATFCNTEHRSLAISNRRASTHSTFPATLFSFYVGLIHLYRRSLQLYVLRKQTANLSEHTPCSLIGNASFALNLLGRDSTTGRAHEVHCIKPETERSSGLLKDGSRKRVNVIAAMVAGIGSATRDAVMLSFLLAFRAIGYSRGITLLFDVFKAGIIIGKFRV